MSTMTPPRWPLTVAIAAALLVTLLTASAPASAQDPGATPGPETRRLLARIAEGDIAGGARLLESLEAEGHAPDAAAARLVRALTGDLEAVSSVLWQSWSHPVGDWLVVLAARGLARRFPMAAAMLAWALADDEPAGRAARRVAVEALDDSGARPLAEVLVAETLGDPAARVRGLARGVVRTLGLAPGPSSESARGWLLYDIGALDRAAAAFSRSLAFRHGAGGSRCWSLHGAGRAALRKADPEVGRALLEEAIARCPGHELTVEAGVLLARSAFAERDDDAMRVALDRLAPYGQRVLQRHGVQVLATLADARGTLAKVARRARNSFQRTVFRDPVGDVAMDLWQVHFDRRQLRRARAALEPLVEAGHRAPRRRQHGQLDYWLGVTLRSLGDHAAATRVLARGVERYPLTWYGLLALDALGELDPDRAAVVRASVPRPEHAPTVDCAWEADAASARARDRIEHLTRWGYVDAAWDEALAAGLDLHAGRAAWVAEHLGAAGSPRRAASFARRAIDHLELLSPVEGPIALWRAAYPRPFQEEVASRCADHGVDPLLVWAVMRVESFYKTTAVSRAGARGLLQLMPSTADWLRKIGSDPRPDVDLHDPPDNLDLGIELLGRLDHRFDARKPLMLAGYNAGSGRISRHLRKKRTPTHLAAWVERLPWSEARSYVRSVLGHWAVYQYLYGCGCVADIASDLRPMDGN